MGKESSKIAERGNEARLERDHHARTVLGHDVILDDVFPLAIVGAIPSTWLTTPIPAGDPIRCYAVDESFRPALC